MNQEQNNILGGVPPVTPTQGVEGTTNNMFISNAVSGMGNNGGNNSVIPNVAPIMNNSTTDMSSNLNTVSNNVNSVSGEMINNSVTNLNNGGDITGNTIIPVTPIPVSVDNTPVMGSVTDNNVNSVMPNATMSSELKIENSSPFDIGVNNSNNNSVFVSPMNSNSFSNNSFGVSSGNENISSGNDLFAGNNSNSGNNVMNSFSSNGMVMDNNMNNQQNNINNNINTQPSNNNVPLTNTNKIAKSTDEVVSVGKFLGHMLLFSIPLVGFVMLFVKAFGKNNNKNISNYAKAQLLFGCIIVVVSVLMSIIFSTALIAIGNTISNANNTGTKTPYTSIEYN